MLLLAALLACKKKAAEEKPNAAEPPPAATTAAPVAIPAPTPTQTAAPAASQADVAGAAFKVGDEIDVNWNGEWWKATVLAVKAGPRYKVHYVGWGNNWDELVLPARVRPRTAGSRSQ